MTTAAPSRRTRRTRRLVSLAGALTLLGAAGCAADSTEWTGSSGSDVKSCASGATLKGVDVSSYQGSVNWSAAKASGIAFGFAKATEGLTIADADFAHNWAGMKAAGVVRGAYHFFHPNESASAQAAFVVKTVGALDAADLPIVLDFEVLDGVSESTAVADAVTFLKAVQQATGKTPIVYLSSGFLGGSYSSLSAYPVWVANYGVSCPGLPSEWGHWSFWQNSDSGSVSGVSGGTDVDEWNGSLADLQAFVASTGGGSSSSSGGGSGSGSGSSSGGGSSSSSGGSSSSSGGGSGSSSGGGTASCTLGGATYANGTCAETLECDNGSWVARTSDPSACVAPGLPGGACLSDTGTSEPLDTCTSTLQCDNGLWVDRMTDPAMCLGSTTTSCTLGGTTYAQNTCTETKQCDSGSWVSRTSDPSACLTGIESGGACIDDTGAVQPQNTCTSTLQCDNGVWVARSSDPSKCL